MITYDEFVKMQEQMEKAKEDDTPRLAVTDGDEMHILGDPGKTERKTGDYTVLFAFPKEDKYRSENVIKETEHYLVVEREYKNVFIPARRHASVVSAFAVVESMMTTLMDNGEIRDLDENETRMLLETLSDEVEDAVYEAVAKTLRIDPKEADCMIVSSAIKTAVEIMANNPEIINEADLFFG